MKIILALLSFLLISGCDNNTNPVQPQFKLFVQYIDNNPPLSITILNEMEYQSPTDPAAIFEITARRSDMLKLISKLGLNQADSEINENPSSPFYMYRVDPINPWFDVKSNIGNDVIFYSGQYSYQGLMHSVRWWVNPDHDYALIFVGIF